jgi:hypothetical protein
MIKIESEITYFICNQSDNKRGSNESKIWPTPINVKKYDFDSFGHKRAPK